LRSEAQDLERYDQLMRNVIAPTTEPPSPHKLEVFVFRHHAGMRTLWPDLPDGVQGFYSTSADRIIAVSYLDESGTLLSGREILFHEYAHHFMFQYFETAYPRWVAEGFAEYAMTTHWHGDIATIGDFSRARADALVGGSAWVPMTTLLKPPESMSM